MEGLVVGTLVVDNDLVFDFYMIFSPVLDLEGICVPNMGVYVVDVRSLELVPENFLFFIVIFIFGFYVGVFIFIESMVI